MYVNVRQVVFLEELDGDPVGTLEGVLEFIGLDPIDSSTEKNVGPGRGRQDIATSTRGGYKHHNK